MAAANAYEAYDAIETRLAPRLEAFVRTGHYAELSAILAKARASSVRRHLRTPPASTREEVS